MAADSFGWFSHFNRKTSQKALIGITGLIALFSLVCWVENFLSMIALFSTDSSTFNAPDSVLILRWLPRIARVIITVDFSTVTTFVPLLVFGIATISGLRYLRCSAKGDCSVCNPLK